MTDHRLRVVSGSTDGARLLRLLDDTTIRIVLGDPLPSTAHQFVATTIVDLLARTFPRLDVVVAENAPAAAQLPPGPALLGERLQHIRTHGGLEPLPAGIPDFTIAIGGPAISTDLYVDGDGWQSYLGTQPSRLRHTDSAIPFAPLVAAARAAAHAQTHALRTVAHALPLPESVYSSVLGYQHSTEPLDDLYPPASGINAVLVGGGSIGGAAIYAFARVEGLHGHLITVDPQPLEDRNPVRSILAHAADADAAKPKAAVAAEALAHLPGLKVEKYQSTIAAYHATLDRTAILPLVLCAVDSIESRREVQDCLPLELINAACHPDVVMLSRHITDDGPCVCCLHMEGVLDRQSTRAEMIRQATGLDVRTVIQLLVSGQKLGARRLRDIETHREMPGGSLRAYEERSLEDLWREQLLYGETRVRVDGAVVAVAAPHVTALAGFLLAAEASKPPHLPATLGLGPHGAAVRYSESPYSSPLYARLDNPPRWHTTECLCRSTRRLRLMRQRYHLREDRPA